MVVCLSTGPALAAAPSSSYTPFTATGSVIANHDGDTFKLQTPDHGILTIRFSGIDTPETGQAFWKSARRALAGLVKARQSPSAATREWHGRDVCKVFTGKGHRKTDVGFEMVSRGMAWYAFQYAAELTTAEQLAYSAAEEKARLAKVGLWAEPDPSRLGSAENWARRNRAEVQMTTATEAHGMRVPGCRGGNA